jgi:hypothetical protein
VPDTNFFKFVCRKWEVGHLIPTQTTLKALLLMETRSRNQSRARGRMSGAEERHEFGNTPTHSRTAQPTSPRQVAAGTVAATGAGVGSSQQGVDPALIAQIVGATISSLNLPLHFQIPFLRRPRQASTWERRICLLLQAIV